MISKISKKEHDKIKHDQTWGIHDYLLFTFERKRYKCDKTGAAGLKEVNRFIAAQRKIKSEQLDLLGIPKVVE